MNIMEVLEVYPNWLFDGTGDIFKDIDQKTLEEKFSDKLLDENEKELRQIESFLSVASDEDKELVMNLVNRLLEKYIENVV